jgi:hypothetical protein
LASPPAEPSYRGNCGAIYAAEGVVPTVKTIRKKNPMTKFKATNRSPRDDKRLAMDSDIEVARASRDEACAACSNTWEARNELLQSVYKAKAALDEALRLSDEIWDDLKIDDLVLKFADRRLPGLEDELDHAIERLSEQQTALIQMRAEYTRKSDAYSALKTPAPVDAALPSSCDDPIYFEIIKQLDGGDTEDQDGPNAHHGHARR